MGALSGLTRRRKITAAGRLRRAGDAVGAVEALASVLAGAPDDPAANVEMARALHLLEDLEGAEEHYRRALAAQLDYALVVEFAGVVGAQGRLDEAGQYLDAALQIVEADPKLDAGEAHLMRAILEAGGGLRDAAGASLTLIDDSSGTAVHEYAQRLRERLDAMPAEGTPTEEAADEAAGTPRSGEPEGETEG